MRSQYNANDLPLIRGLEEVNSKVQLVHAAWEHLTERQEIGAQCAASARRLVIARSLLIEAVEEWAMSLGRLLGIARKEDGLDRLTQSLEQSLYRASVYLAGMAARGRPDTPQRA